MNRIIHPFPNLKPGTPNFLFMLIFAFMLTACSGAAQSVPTATPTLVASLTASPTPDTVAAVASTLTAIALSPEAQILLTSPPAPVGTLTETPVVVTLPALAGERIPPPLDITLPEGWETVGYDVLVLNDVGEIRGVPLAVYSGPVTGGTGTIVLLWGFQNVIDPPPPGATATPPDLWSDGLRLLRLGVVEQGCNVGTDLKRSYRVGLLAAVGTQFAAVDCPELSDTRGWFAGLQEHGLNFVFYAYTEPITAMDTGSDALQSILDTVRFRVPETTAAP